MAAADRGRPDQYGCVSRRDRAWPAAPEAGDELQRYERWFGNVFSDGRYMPNAVDGFFDNGGKRLYVCRIVGDGATTASKTFGDFKVGAVGPGDLGSEGLDRIQQSSTKARMASQSASA